MAESTRPLEWRRARRCAGGNCIEVAKDGNHYLIRDSSASGTKPLQVNAEDWAAFVSGVRDGDFQFE